VSRDVKWARFEILSGKVQWFDTV